MHGRRVFNVGRSMFDVYLSKQLNTIGLRPDWNVENPKLSENYQSGEEQLCPN
jgi:hypothetical protein